MIFTEGSAFPTGHFCPGSFARNVPCQGPLEETPGSDLRQHPVQPLCLQTGSPGLGAVERPEHLWQGRVPRESSGGSKAHVCLHPRLFRSQGKAVTAGLRAITLSVVEQRRGSTVTAGLGFQRLPSSGHSTFKGASNSQMGGGPDSSGIQVPHWPRVGGGLVHS